MQRLFLISILTLFTPKLLADTASIALNIDCKKINPQEIRANYLLVEAKQQQLSKKITRTVFDFMRTNNKLIYHYSKLYITDIWWLDEFSEIHLKKAFLSFKRAIEYEPVEIKMLVRQRWQKLNHLFNPNLLAKLKKTKQTQHACLNISHYQGRIGQTMIHIKWLDQLKLPLSYSMSNQMGRKQYQMQSLKPIATTLLDAIDTFDSTDFADIGDNESDPFLARMINLGFIHHTHSNNKHSHTQP